MDQQEFDSIKQELASDMSLVTAAIIGFVKKWEPRTATMKSVTPEQEAELGGIVKQLDDTLDAIH